MIDHLTQVFIGEKVREFREASGRSQFQLARIANIHPQSISDLERGVQAPNVSTLLALATALGVQVGDLFPPIIPSAEASPGTTHYTTTARTPRGTARSALSGPRREGFAQNLRATRERRGLSQIALAHMTGDPSALDQIAKWENGRGFPKNIVLLARVIQALGTTFEELTAGAIPWDDERIECKEEKMVPGLKRKRR